MAKQQQETDVKKMLEKLYSVIKTTSEFSREQVKINRDLLKVMALLNDGFAKNAADANDLIADITSGVEETDKFFQKWAKDRGATKKDLEEIEKKFKDIDEINDDIIEGSKDYIDLLKERHDFLIDEGDIGKSLLKNHNEILNAVRLSKKEIQAMGGSLIGADDVIKKMVAKKVDFATMFEEGFSSTEKLRETLSKMNQDIEGMISNVTGGLFNVDLNFNPLTGDLEKEVKEVLDAVEKEKNTRIDGLSEYFQKNKMLQTNLTREMAAQSQGLDIKINVDTGELSNVNGILRKGSEEYQKMVDSLDELVSKNNLVANLESSFSEIAELVKLGAERTGNQSDRLTELLKPMGLATQLLVEQVEAQQQLLQGDIQQLMKQQKTVEVTGKYIGNLKSAESIVNKIGTGFDYVNSILPAGIGEFLGISQVSMNLTEAHKKGVQKFTEEIGKGVDYSTAMQGYFQSFKPSLMAALNPVTLMVSGFVLLYKFTESLTNKYKDMTSEMKISLGQAQKMLTVQLDTLTSQKNQFAQLKDIQEIQTAMIGSSGKMFNLDTEEAKNLSLELVEVGKYFGYGNTQAVELQKTFKKLGADDKLALTLQKNLGYMSEMAGISPQIVAQDLVDSAEMVSTYFAGMPDKAARAAIQVRKMGMSLQQAGAIAQRTLDIDGFLTDMYELYAMSGQGIDFTEAFEFGQAGEIEKMTGSIMKQIGSLENFDNMHYLTRSKMAKTLGMSNDELRKSVKLNEDMKTLPAEQQKWLEGNMDIMKDMNYLSREDLQNKISATQSTQKLEVAWEKIKGVLFSALIPLAEALGEAIDAIGPVIDILILGMKAFAGIVKLLSPIVKGILVPFKLIAESISYMTGQTKSFNDGIMSSFTSLNSFQKIIYGIGAAIGSWFVITKAPKFVYFIIKSFIRILTFVPTVIKTIFGLFSTVTTTAQKTSDDVTTVTKNGIDAQVKAAESAKAILQKTSVDVKTATQDMGKEVEASVKKTKKEVAKPTKLGISADSAKTGFKFLGELATKSLTALAIDSASSFLFMRKEGEAQTGAMADNMQSIMGVAFTGLTPMLFDAFQKGIERTFTKRLEKTIEGKLESPIKKASKAFESMDTESTGVFSKIKNKAKGLFSSFGSLSKALSSSGNLTGSFDAMAGSAEKVIPKVENVSEVIDKVKNKKVIEPISIDEQPIKELKPETIVPEKQKSITEDIEKPEKPKKKIEVKQVIPKKQKSIAADIEKPVKESGKKLDGAFDFMTKLMENVWSGLKTVLTDIVKFVSSSMKELSSGIGESIKNILKGIGDGLSSFKGSALKGAATLVVLSGALWITSEAVKNFTTVKWEDLAKAGLALGGLVVASMLLSSASSQMILGAASIAILGASLIPVAFAINMFNDVSWNTLGIAGAALVGLAVAAGVLGAMMMSGVGAVALTLGAAAIAILGASLIPLAAALNIASPALEKISPIINSFGGVIKTTFEGISKVIDSTTTGMVKIFGVLGNIDVTKLFSIGPALISISAGLIALSASMAGGSIMSGISKMFGGTDVITDLERLGQLADPLQIVQSVLFDLNDTLANLATTLTELDFSSLDQLKTLPKIGIEANVQQKIQPIVEPEPIRRDNTNVKVSPVQLPVAKPLPPSKEAVAQDKRLNVKTVSESELISKNSNNPFSKQDNFNSTVNRNQDTYNNTDVISDFRNIEIQLDKMVHLLELLLRKEVSVNMDAQKVNSILKGKNNNR